MATNLTTHRRRGRTAQWSAVLLSARRTAHHDVVFASHVAKRQVTAAAAARRAAGNKMNTAVYDHCCIQRHDDVWQAIGDCVHSHCVCVSPAHLRIYRLVGTQTHAHTQSQNER